MDSRRNLRDKASRDNQRETETNGPEMIGNILTRMLAAGSLPVWYHVLSTPREQALLICFVAAAVLVLVRHHSNIRNLLAGTEDKLGSGAPLHPTPPETAP